MEMPELNVSRKLSWRCEVMSSARESRPAALESKREAEMDLYWSAKVEES